MQMMELGDLERLISLLTSASAGCQENAAWAIGVVCSFRERTQHQAVELGCLPPLIIMLASSSAECNASAAKAIASICNGNQAASKQIEGLRGLQPLIGLLVSASADGRKNAAMALQAVCSHDGHFPSTTVKELDAKELLVKLQSSEDPQVRAAAESALSCLRQS